MGRGCADCQENFYKLADECKPCPKQAILHLLLSIVPLLLAVLILHRVSVAVRTEIIERSNAIHNEEDAEAAVNDGSSVISQVAAIMTLVGGAQTVGAVVGMDFSWPAFLVELWRSISVVVNFQLLDVVPPECAVGAMDTHSRWFFTLVVPFFCMFVPLFFCDVAAKW